MSQSSNSKHWSRCVRVLGLFLVCSATLTIVLPFSSRAQAPNEKKTGETALDLQALEDFHSAEQAGARKAITSLEATHRAGLEKYRQVSKDAGNLNAVVAAQSAIDDLDAGRIVLPSEDRGVAAIEKSYLDQRKTAEAESVKLLAKIDAEYLAALRKLVVELTKKDQIQEALAAQKAADQFVALTARNDLPGKSSAGSAELEMWKKKASEEFPLLKDERSNLSVRVRMRVKVLSESDPSYFSNPQWPYLLAKEASLALPPTGNSSGNSLIPTEAVNFNGKKYLVYEEQSSWKNARTKCEKLAGQLAMIKDAPTQAFIKDLAKNRKLWLGATDEKKEGLWVWVDGAEMKFKQFSPQRPDNAGGKENFLITMPGGTWDDVVDKWGGIEGYICEWPDK